MFSKENSSLVSSKGKKGKDVPLRKSDRRRLREHVQTALALSNNNQQTEEILDAVFLQGTIISRTMIVTDYKVTMYIRSPSETLQDSLWPYQWSAQCVWLELDESQHVPLKQVPTLPLLSILPQNSIPTVSVAPHISKYICRGAHLMKAGMFSLPDTQSRVCAVQVHGNPQPFAVGILAPNISSVEDVGMGKTGVGVYIVTAYGDDLWKNQRTNAKTLETAKVSPLGGAPYDAGHYGNVGFLNGQWVVPIKYDDGKMEGDESAAQLEDEQEDSEEQCNDGTPGGSKNQDDAHVEAEVLPNDNEESDEASPDEVLHRAVCKALASINPKNDLPMTMAHFYAQHVLPSRPKGSTINLKQTKYKKFGAYVQEHVESGLLVVGPDASKKDPLAMLVNFDKRHPDVRPFVQLAKDKPIEGKKRLLLVDLYSVPHHFGSLLRLDKDIVSAANASSEERKDTGMLTVKEMRAILEDYIEREGLADRDVVSLDGPLTDALFKKGGKVENPPQQMNRKDIVTAWQARMQPSFALVEMPGNNIIKLGRGKPPQVLIEVSMRQSKKFITRVRGIEDYGIDVTYFCKDVSHRFACSASIEDNPDGRAALRKGYVELVFQGNLVDELEALLSGDESLTDHGGAKGSDYNLPKTAIEVILRKGVPARKKKSQQSKKNKS